LAPAVTGAERPRRGRAALQVVLPDRGPLRARAVVEPGLAGDGVAEAVAAADETLVDARELHDDVVERRRLDAAARAVDAPATQARRVLIAVARVLDRLHGHEVEPAVARDVDDGRITIVVGVHRVEDVARVGVEPADVRVAAAARHDAEARAPLRLPREDAAPLAHVLEAEDERAEDEHDVV